MGGLVLYKGYDMDLSLISNATLRNWNRLSNYNSDRLAARSNKKLSRKQILPIEYVNNQENFAEILKIIEIKDENRYSIEDVIYSLAINLLNKNELLGKEHTKRVLGFYSYKAHAELLALSLPNDESDFLGLVYQSLLREGQKNIKGSYYTPFKICKEMVQELDFSNEQIFLDPCCGSGAFLLALENVNPKQLYAIDKDPIAVFITKINLLLKYRIYEFIPQVICCDYLDDVDSPYAIKKYDYIITNPPWGAMNNAIKYSSYIKSRETFSLFFEKAYYQLKEKGIIRCLFPEAILNVKTHSDIRNFILEKGSLERITYYSDHFSGVASNIVDILLKKHKSVSRITVKKNDREFLLNRDTFYITKNKVFNIITDADNEIIKKVREKGKETLSNSVWALGIVTGDNKTKLKNHPETGYEVIYTGKEILPFRLKPEKKYILYDRDALQQVAKDEYYRAPEKLVYKFISNKLVFAYDNKGSLFLNSANILIPNIPGMSIKTVMAFLNSDIYQYLYLVLFSEIKVLKGNLCELPFPAITEETDNIISSYSDFIIDGRESYIKEINDVIYNIFEISNKEREYITEVINGTFNR